MKTQATTPRRDAAAEFIREATRAGAKEKPARRRVAKSRAELQRERDQHWYLLLLSGYTYREVAARSNVVHTTIVAAVKRIPEPVKASLRSKILGTG